MDPLHWLTQMQHPFQNLQVPIILNKDVSRVSRAHLLIACEECRSRIKVVTGFQYWTLTCVQAMRAQPSPTEKRKKAPPVLHRILASGCVAVGLGLYGGVFFAVGHRPL